MQEPNLGGLISELWWRVWFCTCEDSDLQTRMLCEENPFMFDCQSATKAP